VGYLVVLAYFRTPGLSPDGRLPFYLAVSLSAVVAIVVGSRRYRPANWLPWALVAVSQLVYFAADVVFYTYHDILEDGSYPAPADAIYLAHYPFLAAGLLLLAKSRKNPVIDTLIIGTAFALLVWVLLMDPYTHASAGSLLLRLTSLAYPVMDLIVLLAALRLIGTDLRIPAMGLLVAALVFLLFSDFVYGWLQVKGKYSGPGDFLDATWMTYYLLLGAAALSPSIRRLGEARRRTRIELSRARILALTAAAFVAPTAALVEHASDKPVHIYATAIASIVIFALVVARLAGVASAQRREQAEKERLLGRVVEVAERERMRVAGDLHDGPLQKLSGLALRLELLASQIAHGEVDEASASVRRVRDELAAEMQALRRLMANLRPPVIDERGIASALRDLAGQLIHHDTDVHAESSVDRALPPGLEAILFNIAREALLNVNEHAQARRVDMAVLLRDDDVVLSIRDDGRGFDAGKRTGPRHGLTSMEDLARSVDGALWVVSGRGAGTEVRAVIPVSGPPAYGSELSQVTSSG
jgi:signal transduction histidine kinase